MKLNDVAIKNTKPKEKPYKLTDGGGMFLLVHPNGSKYWRLKYRFLGKENTLGLGQYPQTSLKEARERRERIKKQLEQGIDPAHKKKQDKLSLKVVHGNTFESIAREWHSQKQHSWKPVHAETILKRLEANIFPIIGKHPITHIETPELLHALRKLEEQGKRDLAHRQLQHCGQIFRYAIATGRAKFDITANLKGALQPAISKGHAHLTEKELPPFLKKLEHYDGKFGGTPLTKLAFKLLILSFVRSGEIRGAKWEEIDWAKKEWKIPAARMKMDSPHVVPLAKQAIAILKEVQDISGDNYAGYIFPSHKNPRNIMSENTFLRAIEVMGYKGKTTGHGFRSTASTILNEEGFNKDWIERQLAHCERDQVRGAYNHAEFLKDRHKMMQWWANYIDSARKK